MRSFWDINMPHRPSFVLLCLFLLAGISSCAKSTANKQTTPGEKLLIVTTTGMIADMVKNITQDKAKVECLMGPGVDPHSYEPRESDITKILSADFLVFNGLHLEGKMADLLEQSNRKGNVLAIADALTKEDIRMEGDSPDPHIWFDISLWKKCSKLTGDKLCQLVPDQASFFRSNLDAYLKKLDDLESHVRTSIAAIPKPQRVLVTAHDAFGYFGKAYGFEVRGVQGISTVSESSNQEIASLGKFMVERKIHAFFIENSVSRKNLDKLREVIQSLSRDFALREGGELYSDALGHPGSSAGTYEGMIRHNIDSILKGLAP